MSLGLCHHGRGNPFATQPPSPSRRRKYAFYETLMMVSCGFKRDVQKLCAVVQQSWAVCVSCKILSLERAGQDVSSCVEICAGANGHRIHTDIGDHYIDIKCKEPHKTVTHFLSYLINLLKPSGYVCTTKFITNSTFCPHSVFICFFLWIWEQTSTISLYRINW